MNIFVLCTGRSGSKTFIKACNHITNYTCGHESRAKRAKLESRLTLDYPPNHIEADNRLSWFLGRLDERYGDEAFYVHLIREKGAVAQSFYRRWKNPGTIISAYGYSLLKQRYIAPDDRLPICLDYQETVNSNIRLFLKDKTKVMTMHLESITEQFPIFWNYIGAFGNLDEALGVLQIPHNISPPEKISGLVMSIITAKTKISKLFKDSRI